MVKRIGAVICGLGLLYSAWGFYAHPQAQNAPERGGWLFKTYGQSGLIWGTAGLGFLALLIGCLLVWNALRAIARVRKQNKEDRQPPPEVFDL
jgi:hypothetical protein